LPRGVFPRGFFVLFLPNVYAKFALAKTPTFLQNHKKSASINIAYALIFKANVI
jgi:hypothetical protein